MARLTRTESQARNRDQLLAAAERLFLREGYQSASISKIADEAELSTGAVYSNFAGKQEVALLVVRRLQDEHMGRLGPLLAGFPAPDAVDGLWRWAEDALGSGWPRLELEFALDATSAPELVAAESQRHRSTIAWLAGILDDLAPLLPAGMTAEGCAEAVLNLAIGVAVRRVIDPSVTVQPLRELVEAMFVPPEPAA
ncbi:TetR/AcrR family transcriptional regulator [Actinomadura hibisca]|uniref:TetR/AcrR family transcriptional regulator n=1 Tax=Actinomadura hibisca TaxID=68565 RepID=UPI00082B6433|nr:TetR/AcrR family transcriptional regulator [Actinomadura hibisca]